MEKVDFSINDKMYEVSVKGSPPLQYGKDEVLSTNETDIAFNQPWYDEGYKAINFLNEEEFKNVSSGLSKCIQSIIASELGIEVENFEMSKYHHVVKTAEEHYKVVGKTRDLFPEDFHFPIAELTPRFENILGFKLTDIDPYDGVKLHIIIRINRPLSTDYNPPHKDIYEGVDNHGYIPQFINFWIPICGVTPKSSLPVAASSHLLPENQILRTFDGGVVGGNKYRVRMIAEWGGSHNLTRPVVNYGEVLFFSSHLVHGLAINEEEDQTRVALEFRLFKQN